MPKKKDSSSSTVTKKPSRNISTGTAPANGEQSEFLTISEAAAYLRVGRQQIDYAIRHRRLKVLQLTKSRRCLRIYRPDLMELLDVLH